MLENDEVFSMLSLQWQQSLHERNQSMQKLTNINDLRFILKNISKLRHLEGYYLRSVTINLFNSTVSMSGASGPTMVISISLRLAKSIKALMS
jgi:hypothetical protein